MAPSLIIASGENAKQSQIQRQVKRQKSKGKRQKFSELRFGDGRPWGAFVEAKPILKGKSKGKSQKAKVKSFRNFAVWSVVLSWHRHLAALQLPEKPRGAPVIAGRCDGFAQCSP